MFVCLFVVVVIHIVLCCAVLCNALTCMYKYYSAGFNYIVVVAVYGAFRSFFQSLSLPFLFLNFVMTFIYFN